MVLSSSPGVAFPLVVENSSLSTLADLLSHENPDVAVSVVQVLEEFSDPEGLEPDPNDDEDDDEVRGGTATGESAEERDEQKRRAVRALLEAVREAGVVEIVVSGLKRFDEADEDQRTGVFHTLSLLENLLTLSPSTFLPILLSPTSPFLSYLVDRLTLASPSPAYDQNKYYAAEMLSFVLSLSELDIAAGDDDEEKGQRANGSTTANKSNGVLEARMRVGSEGWVEALLKVLSVYRKRDPSSSDETEFMENCFDVLCTTLSSRVPSLDPLTTTDPSSSSSPTGRRSNWITTPHPVKQAFLEAEGVELMLLLLSKASKPKSKKHPHHAGGGGGEQVEIGLRSLKCLSHALSGCRVEPQARQLGERFVEGMGLKSLFSIFMGKSSKKRSSTLTPETVEHIVSILASLLTSLPSDSPPRLRVLTKFIEDGYSKLDRLLEVRNEVDERIERAIERYRKVRDELDDEVEAVQGESEQERNERRAEEEYFERLENGGMSLQFVDYVAAWICMEDDGAREHYEMILSRESKSLRNLIDTLAEYRDNIAIDPTDLEPRGAKTEGEEQEEQESAMTEGELQRAILDQLVQYLEGVAKR
ncbi:hypothetical protein JCM10212_002028 [Sporobolomyces blumeae]